MEKEIEMEQEPIIIQKGGGGAVNSVNGKTGDVVLTTSDLQNTSDYQNSVQVSEAINTAVGDATLTVQKNSTTIDTFSANAKVDKTINITVPVTASDVNALPSSTKYGASLVMSIDSSTYVVTATLKDQDGNTLGNAQTIDLPLESVVVGGSYDSVNKKIVLTLQNGNTIDVPVADLVSGLQTEITSTNKLASDLVDDTDQTNKFVTTTEKTFWNGKQDALTAGTNITIEEDSGTGDVVISATDTTYSDFVGTDGVNAGAHGLVPAPATTDAGKFLKADGSWDTAGGGGGLPKELSSADYNWPVGSPDGVAIWLLPSGLYKGNSSTYIYKQTSSSKTNSDSIFNASAFQILKYEGGGTYSGQVIAIFDFTNQGAAVIRWNASGNIQTATNGDVITTNNLLFNSNRKARVQIGDSANTGSDYAIAIGSSAYVNDIDNISMGRNAGVGESGQGVLCFGRDAKVTGNGGIALGTKSLATSAGEMNIGTSDTGYGYNSSNYRLISGVYDGQSAHDVATVGQINSTIDAINTALSVNIPHIGA